MLKEPELLAAAAESLPDWYESHRASLPWRSPRTPYRTLVSEIMLQQTRTAAVVPYFERFIGVFPTVEALAASDEDEVLKLWEGLGYYSRARNLRRAAIQVIEEHGGVFPQTAHALRTLSGVGDYTAGAIASLCFGEPSPAVDGNVLRVIARYMGLEEDITLGRTKKEVTQALEAVYPTGERSGLLTEAIMELGETVCIPNGEPRCLDCPLAERCTALREGRMRELPVRSRKKPRTVADMTVAVLCHRENGRLYYAIRKRPRGGLLGGLWELPNCPDRRNAEEAAEFARTLGVRPTEVTQLSEAVHKFTHREWHMTGYRIVCEGKPSELLWVTKEELAERYAIPRAFEAFVKGLL